MKLPYTFLPEKDMDDKMRYLEAKEVQDPPVREDIPKTILTFSDAARYVMNSVVTAYGFDDKKRIKPKSMTLKEVYDNEVNFGVVDLFDENAISHKGAMFSQSKSSREKFSLEICAAADFASNEILQIKGLDESAKKVVNWFKGVTWQLTVCNTPDFWLLKKSSLIKVDTPEEILWVFEAFKEYNPRIHGGALRDLYLGIERTGDVDVELEFKGGWFERRRLYKHMHRALDDVEFADKGKKIDNGYWDVDIPAQYKGTRNGVKYDISTAAADRYLSTEQVTMRRPGELIIYDLTKNDLDNRQFRFINMTNVPERIIRKVEKLEKTGLTFLPENPRDVSKNIDIPFLETAQPKRNASAGYY